MIRKNKGILIDKKIVLVGIFLIIVTLLSGCQRRIPKTQKHDYTETPYVDYSLASVPEFVDDISLCTDSEKQYVLPDGYLYGCKPVPIYSVTNFLAAAEDENGGIYNGCGYRDGLRIRSVLKEMGETDFSFVTGFIPIKKGDIVYFSGNCFDSLYKNAKNMHIVFYNENKQIVSSTAMNTAEQSAFVFEEKNEDGYVSAVRLREDFTQKEISYVRFTLIGSGKGKVISVNEPLVSSDYTYEWVQLDRYIPVAWYEEIKTTVETVNNIEILDENQVVRFMFASDIHLDPYSSSSYTENLGKISAEIMRACNIPFFVTGGDNCTQSSGFMPSDFQPNMEAVLAQLLPIPQKNILLAVGNHDGATGMAYNNNGEKVYYRFQLNNEERSSVFFDWQRATNENKKFDSDGTYYYLDDSSTKTRYIVLNSFWSQWQGNDEGYVHNIEHSFFQTPSFGSRQLHWFAEEALDMPKGYGAVIVAHFAPDAKDFEIFKGIVDAFSFQTIYKGEYYGAEEWQSVNIVVNYEKAYGEIIAVFQGHEHTDAVYDFFEKVPCINITTAGAFWSVKDEDAEDRVKGTASEFAVDVVTIDRFLRKIYLTRLGAEEDRVIRY